MRFWDEWRGSIDGRPSMFIRHLLYFKGYRLDLHKFIRADDLTCFHTHPAKAIRIILLGGYTEQIYLSSLKRKWVIGSIGIVRPELCHRIDRLLNGKYSFSLWLRWPKTNNIKIYGEC